MATKTHANEQAQKSNDGGAALGEQMTKTSQKKAKKQTKQNKKPTIITISQPTSGRQNRQKMSSERKIYSTFPTHPHQKKNSENGRHDDDAS